MFAAKNRGPIHYLGFCDVELKFEILFLIAEDLAPTSQRAERRLQTTGPSLPYSRVIPPHSPGSGFT
jgi:hypothetical protein